MVDKKISELPEVTSVSESDVVPIVVDDNGLITSKVQVGDLRAPPDNKTLALDDDEKLSFSKPYYNVFNELILKNLINSYENNLSDLTYDFAQADSFHIENGINGTVDTNNDLVFKTNKYTNFSDGIDTVTGNSANSVSDTTVTLEVNILKRGYFNSFSFYSQNPTSYTVTIKDSSNNILAQKNTSVYNTSSLYFSESDYSRLLQRNETIFIEYTVDNLASTADNSFTGDGISFSSQLYIGWSNAQTMTYTIEDFSNGSLNTSVSDVSDTDSVALFIDSDKPNLITPTYNTSGGELNSIDFSFSDTEAINFYGYVLYIYK